jgi:hypothetical protein
VEEKEVTVEKRTTVRREDPVESETTNVNIGPDGTTNVQESGEDPIVEEEHVVEERREP